MRRYITFWRVVVVLILIMVAISFMDQLRYQRDHIARVEISRMILNDYARHRLLVDLAGDEKIQAVLVKIDSPGGLAGASEEIYHDLREIAEQKPVVALMGDVAASGGYVVALGADYILARPTTITGSIGVVLQWVDASGLAQKIGIRPYTIRSGDLKARPDFFEKPSPETLRYVKRMINETFDWFIDLVARRRLMDKTLLLEIAGDGRIFTGRRAYQLELVDGLGGEKEAREWLFTEHGVARDMSIEDYRPTDPDASLWSLFLTALGLPLPSSLVHPKLSGGLMLLWQF